LGQIKQKNEYYTSTVIKEMIKDNFIFTYSVISEETYNCLGTPTQVKIFYNKLTKYNNKFVLDDLETPEQSDTDHNDDSSDASDSDHESIELFEEDPEEYYEEDYFDEPE
jgi:hypothetical protein